MGRKGRELTLDEKKSIISLIENGLQSAKVAEILHLTPSTIDRFLNQFSLLSKIVKRDRKQKGKF